MEITVPLSQHGVFSPRIVKGRVFSSISRLNKSHLGKPSSRSPRSVVYILLSTSALCQWDFDLRSCQVGR